MQVEGLIQIPAEHGEKESMFINPVQLVDVAKLLLPVSTYLATRHIVERWATEPTRKLLDYVYFETEPMENPVRGERLDSGAAIEAWAAASAIAAFQAAGA
jgi:hypothetical protein